VNLGHLERRLDVILHWEGREPRHWNVGFGMDVVTVLFSLRPRVMLLLFLLLYNDGTILAVALFYCPESLGESVDGGLVTYRRRGDHRNLTKDGSSRNSVAFVVLKVLKGWVVHACEWISRRLIGVPSHLSNRSFVLR